MTGRRFTIRIAGEWTPELAERFGDVHAEVHPDHVVLTGELDQAGLHGLLERVRRAGLELIDVRRSRANVRHEHA